MNDTKKYIPNSYSIDSLFNFNTDNVDLNNSILTQNKSIRSKKNEKASNRDFRAFDNASLTNLGKGFSNETSLVKKVGRDSPVFDLKLNNSFLSSEGGNNLMLNQQHREESYEYIYQPNKNLMPMDYVDQTNILLRQYDMMLQLLVQNMLLTSNHELKLKCYSMIYSYYLARSKIMTYYKLPQYDIHFKFCDVRPIMTFRYLTTIDH
jgi:hypothetical protein